ncbi:MAG: DUF3310 domain-containing protein [Candidatus Cloacimonadaceae bacterium]
MLKPTKHPMSYIWEEDNEEEENITIPTDRNSPYTIPESIRRDFFKATGIKRCTEKEIINWYNKNSSSTGNSTNNPIEPNHYTTMAISPLEYIEANPEAFTWCTANVVKYVSRAKMKNGLEDLKKAAWYLNHEIENMEKSK